MHPPVLPDLNRGHRKKSNIKSIQKMLMYKIDAQYNIRVKTKTSFRWIMRVKRLHQTAVQLFREDMQLHRIRKHFQYHMI